MEDAQPPDSDARARRLLTLLAVAGAVLTLIVVVSSAFLRHAQAGLGCDAWPACYARIAVTAPDAAPAPGVRVARTAHRVAATAVLTLILGMLLVTWTQRPVWLREGAWATAAFVIALCLAALGIATPGARIPAVTLGNLLGGYLLLATLAALAATAGNVRGDAWPAHGRRAPLRAAALAILIGAFAQAASGGFIGAQFALTACPTLPGCPHGAGELGALANALDPLRVLVEEDGRVVPPSGAAGLHVLHRLPGIALAIATLVLAFGLRSASRRAASLLAALALAAPLAGAAAIVAMPALALTVLHNALAAALIATLAWVSARFRPTP